ncbi:hypothetical protein HK096_011471, partial [Nowakowskiella sp. JEL0078]
MGDNLCYQQTNLTTVIQTIKSPPTDFLFLVDGSGSMAPYQAKIIQNLQTFINKIQAQNISARYSVVAFGGIPELFKPFDNDVNGTFNALSLIGTGRSGQEAGLEAIRASIDTGVGVNGTLLSKTACKKSYSTANCTLSWKSGSKRAIIFVSDEDSDIPVLDQYLTPGLDRTKVLCAAQLTYDSLHNTYNCSKGNSFEPLWSPKILDIHPVTNQSGIFQFMRPSNAPITLDPAYANEIVLTAQMIVSTGTYVAMLMKDEVNANWANNAVSSWNKYNDLYNMAAKNKSTPASILAVDNYHTSVYQYGDPRINSMASDFSNFDSVKTLQALVNKGLAGSLQAQVLQNN